MSKNNICVKRYLACAVSAVLCSAVMVGTPYASASAKNAAAAESANIARSAKPAENAKPAKSLKLAKNAKAAKSKRKGKYKITKSESAYTIYKGKDGNTRLSKPYGFGGKVKWSSSDKKILKVSQKGVVTGMKKGKAFVFAKNTKKKTAYKWKFTVKPVKQGSKSDFNDLDEKVLKALLVDMNPVMDSMCSPMGLRQALGAATLSCKKDARDKFAKSMGYTDAEAMYKAAAAFLEDSEKDKNEEHRLDIANSFWINTGVPVEGTAYSDFKKELVKYYKTEIFENENLSDMKTIDKINKWCDEHTNGLIKKLFDDPIDGEFATINSLYFNSKWEQSLEMRKYDEAPFYGVNAAGNKEYFGCSSDLQYGRYGKVSSVKIPYSGGRYIMTLYKMDGKKNIVDYFGTLTPEERKAILGMSYRAYPVSLRMPVFKTESKYDFEKPVFDKLGIPSSLPSSNINPGSDCDLECVQQTVINCDESGTEAAAVTAIIAKASAAIFTDIVVPIRFEADHPFIYTISDSSGNIIFEGKVVQ